MNKERCPDGWAITNPDTPHKGRLVRHSYFKDRGIGIIKAEIAFQFDDDGSYTGVSPVAGFLVSFSMAGDIPVGNGHLLWVGERHGQQPMTPSSEPCRAL